MKALAMFALVALGGAVPAHAAEQVVLPIDGFYGRQTIKTFGTYVDQQFLASHPNEFRNNGYPKFTGYHAGVDVDYTTQSEASQSIPVRAAADGDVIYAGTVTGYGGVIVERVSAPESVTLLYGHVKLAGAVAVGTHVTAGQQLTVLGEPFSAETGGERKHLHFGIHRGSSLNLDGHEPTQQALDQQWINPNVWLRRYAITPMLAASPTASPGITPVRHTPHESLWHKFTHWIAGLFK